MAFSSVVFIIPGEKMPRKEGKGFCGAVDLCSFQEER